MPHLEALLRLQEVDLEIIRHKRMLASLPQQEKIHTIKRAARSLASQLTKLKGERKDVEMELADNRATYDHMHEVLDQVTKEASQTTDFRELTSYEQQLTHLARRIDRLDFDKIALDKRLSKLRNGEAKAQTIAKNLQTEAQTQLDEYTNATSEHNDAIAALEQEREELCHRIQPGLLAQYTKAAKRFKGLAVETLFGNNPSVCRVALQPSSYADIRARKSEITTCPYCHRMLVVRDPSYKAQQAAKQEQ